MRNIDGMAGLIEVSAPASAGPALLGAERQAEFVGPPGVGKSTLYRATLEHLDASSPYRTAQEGWHLAALASLNQTSPLRRVARRSAFLAPRIGAAYARRHAAAATEEAFRQALQVHGPFLDCCIDMARTGFGDVVARFTRLPSMLEQLRDLYLWSLLPSGLRILQQDALTQKGWACAREAREAFFSLVPRPGAVIFVTAPADVVVDRLRNRSRRISAHVGLDDRGLDAATRDAAEAFELAAAFMKRRGVPALEVDGRGQPADVGRRIAGFLRDLP
jgi:hypothetical protein